MVAAPKRETMALNRVMRWPRGRYGRPSFWERPNPALSDREDPRRAVPCVVSRPRPFGAVNGW